MKDVVTIGKRVIPIEQIALAERFEPSANPEFKSEKDFKTRVVLLSRETVLTEEALDEFAKAYGLRMLTEDNVAANPRVAFRVETFEPTEEFQPTKPYASRIKWRDTDGQEQSKLLAAQPADVIAIVVRGGERSAAGEEVTRARPRARKGRPRLAGKVDLARA